jgi:hypothetical protein
MATSTGVIERLNNGPATGVYDTPADLPAAPFAGLRLGDFVVALRGTVPGVPSFYQLVPKSTVTSTGALLTAGDRATDWEWREWVAGGAASASWGKYVVSNETLPGPVVLYATYAAARTAWLADGRGPNSPGAILFHPGIFVENCVFEPGMLVAALGGPAGLGTRPPVRLIGTHTVSNVAGTVMLAGVELANEVGAALTVGGTAAIAVELVRCRVDTSGGASRAISHTNTNAGSRLTTRDTQVLAGAAAPDVVNLAQASLQSSDSDLSANGTNLACLVLAPTGATDVLDVGTSVTGTIDKGVGAGPVTLRGARVAATPVPNLIGANATWIVDDARAPNGLSTTAGSSMTARRTSRANPRTTFTGAGPHTIVPSSGPTIAVGPGVDTVAPLNLPDVRTWVQGEELVIVVDGSGLGTAVVPVAPSGAQTIGGLAAVVRLYEGGSLRLRASRSGVTNWDVAGYTPGVPQDLLIVASNAGNDNNAGTAASPVRTVRRVYELADQAPWSRSGKGTLSGAYTDDPNATTSGPIPIPGPIGRGGQEWLLQGSYAAAAGFAAKVPTGSSAGAAGPPVAFARATFGADAAYAADAAFGLYALYSAGPRNATRPLIGHSTNVLVEHPDLGAAPGNNSFQAQSPAAALSSGTALLFTPGRGTRQLFDAIEFQGSGQALLVATGVTVWFNGCRVRGGLTVATGAVALLGPQVTAGGQVDLAFNDLISRATTAYALTPLGSSVALFTAVGPGAYVQAMQSAFNTWDCDGSFTCEPCDIPIAALAANVTFSQGTAGSVQNCLAYNQLTFQFGAQVEIVGLTSNHALGDGLLVSNQAFARVTSFQGTMTGGGSFGLNAAGGARVAVTDAAAGTSATGAAGDVRVGVLGAKTWANIAAAAVANCLEITGAGATDTSVAP